MNKDALANFIEPQAMFRGAPFWSWNCRLDKDELLRQIDVFAEMGIGGFHMHPRTGLEDEYLGSEYMDRIRLCCETARQKGMHAWLYDEDRWPSGFAGGLVTQDPAFRSRYLLITPVPYGADDRRLKETGTRAGGGRNEQGRLLARYAIKLQNGCLTQYRRLKQDEAPDPDATVWYTFLEVSTPCPRFNNQAYIDTLNPEAIKRFIGITHERYRQVVGKYFGDTIPAIFTDEPQFPAKGRLSHPDAGHDINLPFTENLPETFRKTYGVHLLDIVPELIWELPDDQASVWRYRYHDHVAERFADAFADTVGGWCRKNGIALTGHMMHEDTLESQTHCLGEAMRSYRGFDIPGIDVLCDRMEENYNTAKQAQSAAHQFGCPGILSELYGVTNWTFDFAGHKRQGDWQAALGVLYRVHHLTWVGMEGEAKRDYPASIGYQSPWYHEYRVVEDHFARVNSVLSRGEPAVRIGVIHPVESFWLCWGPEQQTLSEREQRDQRFLNLTRWLLYGFNDFDFISESLLPQQIGDDMRNGFPVGAMRYDVILVPGLKTIRATTLEPLRQFREAGGTVLFVGDIPGLVDAEPSDLPGELAGRCGRIPFDPIELDKALASYNDVRLLDANGVQVEGFLHQLRRENEDWHLFICNTDKDRAVPGLTVQIKGEWQPTVLDTVSGDIRNVGAEYKDGCTRIPHEFAAHGSLLLTLTPGRSATAPVTQPVFREIGRLQDPVPVTLSEPNVLLLDYAECRIGDGDWLSKRHILDWDAIVRTELGLPLIGGDMAQPWVDKEPATPVADVRLRMTFESGIRVAGAQLALEQAAAASITLDSKPVAADMTGYFTDKAIQTVRLPDIEPGTHTLEITYPYTRKTYLEWCYLLGDFGVRVSGRHARLTSPVRTLTFGDWTSQGLPFYGGNVTYHCKVAGRDNKQNLAVRTARFSGPLVKAVLDSAQSIPLAFAPFRAELGRIEGEHQLDLTVFGNRANCFGQVHNCAKSGRNFFWRGPASWRTTGDEWADEYQLAPMGILVAPIVEEQRD
jgi:hypothetical protein